MEDYEFPMLVALMANVGILIVAILTRDVVIALVGIAFSILNGSGLIAITRKK